MCGDFILDLSHASAGNLGLSGKSATTFSTSVLALRKSSLIFIAYSEYIVVFGRLSGMEHHHLGRTARG